MTASLVGSPVGGLEVEENLDGSQPAAVAGATSGMPARADVAVDGESKSQPKAS